MKNGIPVRFRQTVLIIPYCPKCSQLTSFLFIFHCVTTISKPWSVLFPKEMFASLYGVSVQQSPATPPRYYMEPSVTSVLYHQSTTVTRHQIHPDFCCVYPLPLIFSISFWFVICSFCTRAKLFYYIGSTGYSHFQPTMELIWSQSSDIAYILPVCWISPNNIIFTSHPTSLFGNIRHRSTPEHRQVDLLLRPIIQYVHISKNKWLSSAPQTDNNGYRNHHPLNLKMSLTIGRLELYLSIVTSCPFASKLSHMYYSNSQVITDIFSENLDVML